MNILPKFQQLCHPILLKSIKKRKWMMKNILLERFSTTRWKCWKQLKSCEQQEASDEFGLGETETRGKTAQMERLMIRRSEWAAPRHLQGRGGATSAKLFQETVILQEQAYLLDTRGPIDPAKVSEAKPAVECRGVAVFSAFPFSFSR